MRRASTLAVWLPLAVGGLRTVAAQGLDGASPELRAYYLHVGSASASGPLSESAVTDLQRVRFMSGGDLGPVALDVAYEHFFRLTSSGEGARLAGGLGTVPASGEWLQLQGTLLEDEAVRWTHRLDRLSVSVKAGPDVELTAGRQTISWASTLLLTPADPFAPFSPEQPFREYRAGVDALRARAFLGPFTDVDLVLRPVDTPRETTVTALGRVRTATGRWELSGWAGVLHDEPVGSLGATATLAGAAFRAEAVLRRENPEEAPAETVLRLAIGADRHFTLAGRDLYVTVEYQRDGFGAASADELPETLLSEPFGRGEMQVLGRDEAALQGSYQIHPLWTGEALVLVNLDDPSLLFAPGASYSVSDEVVARAGAFLGAGEGVRTVAFPGGPIDLPGSEYGPVASFGYLALTAFF